MTEKTIKKTTTSPRSKNKKLNLSTIIEDNKKAVKKKKVVLEKGYYVNIFPTFSYSRIDKMLRSYSDFLENYSKINGEMKEAKVLDYLHLHILIFFTDLSEDKDLSFEEKLNVFEQILESDWFILLFDYFDKDELSKVYNHVFKKIATYQELAKKSELANLFIEK